MALDPWDHALKVIQTQHGIIEFAERAAEVLAEAARASSLAVGDSEETAARRWSDVILKRAIEIIRERREQDGQGTGKNRRSMRAVSPHRLVASRRGPEQS